jgi:hypothetical protein
MRLKTLKEDTDFLATLAFHFERNGNQLTMEHIIELGNSKRHKLAIAIFRDRGENFHCYHYEDLFRFLRKCFCILRSNDGPYIQDDDTRGME